jgi:hypothetical protein
MFRSAAYWKDRADEVRAIADATKDEETRQMMAEIADDYDRLSSDAKGLVTQKERDEEKEAKRLRQQRATASLLDTPSKKAIDALMDTPFSRARAR